MQQTANKKCYDISARKQAYMNRYKCVYVKTDIPSNFIFFYEVLLKFCFEKSNDNNCNKVDN